jgi:hypothetical protein
LASYPATAHASSISAVTFTDPIVAGDGGDRRTLGWEFTVNSDITVIALGLFDAGKDGLGEGHNVGLWDSTGGQLLSVNVPAGTIGTLDGYFRYATATPVVLLGGHNYMIGAAYGEGVPQLDSVINYPPFGSVTGFTTPSAITFVRDLQQNIPPGTSTALFPTFSASVQPSYFGPNFEFIEGAAAVPEPSTIVLVGSALTMFGARRRRQRS